MRESERNIYPIEDPFVPGRLRDIITNLDDNNPWEKRTPVDITTYGGDPLRRHGITPTERTVNHTVNELTDEDIGTMMMINGSPHMIIDINEKEREDIDPKDIILKTVIPVLGLAILYWLTLSTIPSIISYSHGTLTKVSILLITIIILLKSGQWIYRKLVTENENPIVITAVPVWKHYQQDLMMVTNYNPRQRREFIESVHAACVYGNQKMLHEAENIVSQAGDNWRKGFHHPEDIIP